MQYPKERWSLPRTCLIAGLVLAIAACESLVAPEHDLGSSEGRAVMEDLVSDLLFDGNSVAAFTDQSTLGFAHSLPGIEPNAIGWLTPAPSEEPREFDPTCLAKDHAPLPAGTELCLQLVSLGGDAWTVIARYETPDPPLRYAAEDSTHIRYAVPPALEWQYDLRAAHGPEIVLELARDMLVSTPKEVLDFSHTGSALISHDPGTSQTLALEFDGLASRPVRVLAVMDASFLEVDEGAIEIAGTRVATFSGEALALQWRWE